MSEPSRTDLIRRRAYELYLARATDQGAEEGGDFDDWLTAEREVADREEHQIQAHGPDELEMAKDAKGEASCHK